jgi:hypothetical protein
MALEGRGDAPVGRVGRHLAHAGTAGRPAALPQQSLHVKFQAGTATRWLGSVFWA